MIGCRNITYMRHLDDMKYSLRPKMIVLDSNFGWIKARSLLSE